MSTQPKNTKFHHRATAVCTIASLISIGFLPFASSAVADSTPGGGTVITNFATGTYQDPLQLTTTGITSNIVTISISEIAGVSVVGTGIDANPNINPGDIIYFNFTINNLGNDPTQFFIPSLPSSVSVLGTFAAATAPIEIVETKDGNGAVVPLPGGVAKINVPVAGGITSPSVPAGGTVRIRVPIKVAAGVATGNIITVVMGNTPAATRGNQDYVSGGATSTANTDLYTVDNTVTPLPAGEIVGAPVNGDATNHRREASASQDVTINPTVIPTDFGELPSTYKTTLVDNGARHTIVPAVYLGASVTAEADGSPIVPGNPIPTADNDGVIFDPILNQQVLQASTTGNTTNTIKVTASTAGYINAWIDLNGNGTFDPADRVLTEAPVVAGNNNLNITLPNSVVSGKTYARFRFTTGLNQATISTGLAPNGEVEDYQIEIVKTSPAPTITSLCADRNGTTTTNNLIPGGKFSLVDSLATNIPGATTDYIYDTNPAWATGWPNDGSTTPNDGHYLVAPSTGLTTYNNGAWHDLSEHTGDAGGMMVVNGNSSTKVFETTVTGLTVGKTYEFSTWAANLASTNGGSDLPNLKLEYSEDNGASWQLLTDSGSIAKTPTPTWNIYGNFFTPKTTSVKLRIGNNTTGAAGNDFAIDDIRVEGCDVPLVSGRVFEDVNYGGGSGRNYSTAKNSSQNVPIEVANAIVELYEKQPDNSFKKVAQRNTIADGSYQFTTADGVSYNGTYRLRVVNTSVKSNRPGSIATLIPVQTFREDPSAATPEIVNEVGGIDPKLVDAPVQANTTDFTALTTATTVAQSSTQATMNNAEVKNLNFGYNFDTIVNTNDTGQGSLRQFILNSNALTNAGLAQQGLTAGKETSIFMIPNGSAVPGLQAAIPSQLTGGVAVITALTQLPTITDSGTTIDGTTQTTNIGDTNTGSTGTGGTVGTTALALATVNKPEVEINDGTASIPIGLFVRANNTTLRGLSVWGFGDNSDPAAISGDIVTSATTIDANSFPNCTTTDIFTGLLFEQNILGTNAQGFAVTNTSGLTSNNQGKGFYSACGSQGTFQNNLVGFTAGMAAYWSNQQNKDAAMNWQILNNEFRAGGNRDKIDNVGLESFAHDVTLKGNLITGAYANGVSLYNNQSNGNISIANNTITNSGSGGSSSEWAGIAIFTGTSAGVTISQNIINSNKGAGIWVEKDFNGVKITQNSIYSNGGLGIDLKGATLDTGTGNQTILLNTVTPNDGSKAVASIANLGMDYPIITSSVLSGGTLTVKGYVGNLSAGSATFNAPTLEFFIAADDGNNYGAVISGDGKSKSHGEGKTFIGSCLAGTTGLFNCTLPNAGTVGVTDPFNITATATDAAGNTSEFSAAPSLKAQLLLVKRITAITDGVTGQPLTDAAGTPISFSGFVDDTTSGTKTDDNSCNWPTATGTTGACTNTYTVGATTETAPKVKPGDRIEYTIYYLNAGENKASARVCDRLSPNLTFQANFDASNVAKGIGFNPGGTGTTYLGNSGTDGDNGQLTTTTVTNCNLPSNGGTEVVAVDVNPVMGSTGAGTAGSYGYVRFKAVVK